MAKKIILALLILIFIAIFVILVISNDSVDVYMDGENISVETHTLGNVDTKTLNSDICNLTLNVMNDTSSNVTTLKKEISQLCNEYGMENPEINVDSSIGPNQIPVMMYVDGTSMLPTLHDGQHVLVNKTHNIHVGDIVVANSKEYGSIVKRVGDIQGDSVYLISDNKEVTYEYINGVLYEKSGIKTWVNISDINGVVISY